MEFKAILQDYAKQMNMEISELQLEQFRLYFELLVETNKVMNLTAITEPHEVMLKHFLDSICAYSPEVFFANAKVCDLGTGAGFPGIPLQIMYPKLETVLMDSLGKRLKFLDIVVNDLALHNISTCHMRAEDAGRNKLHREKYDVVTSRAVAKLPVLLEYCLPLVKPKGFLVALKAANYEQEIEQSQLAIEKLGGKLVDIKHIQLPTLEDKRVIIYIKKTKNTPVEYPRRAGIPEKNPL